MRAPLREFLHLLAADYGFDSESQDPEPYRSVVVRKPQNYTFVPRKTLGEFINTRPTATAAAPAAIQQLKKVPRGQAVNAFVLRGIRVGILASDLEKELSPTLKESQLRFDISWYGDEDVLLTPRPSSLAIDQIEGEIHSLSTKLKRAIASKRLAESADMCWVGQDGRIANSAGAGWSVANPRKTVPVAAWTPTGNNLASRNGFEVFNGAGGGSSAVIGGKQRKEKEKKKEEEVVEDWEEAAENME